MDVPKQKNVKSPAFITPTLHLNTDNQLQSNGYQATQRSDEHAAQTDDIHNSSMRKLITCIVLGLFVFVVVYGLIRQNYWLVGVSCMPVTIKGV